MDSDKKWHNEAGKFANGNPGKQRGSARNILREEIKNFLTDNWSNFPEWFSKLKPKEKIDTMLDLLPFAVSRLQSVAMTDSEGDDLKKASIDYSKLSESTLREILQNTNTIDGID